MHGPSLGSARFWVPTGSTLEPSACAGAKNGAGLGMMLLGKGLMGPTGPVHNGPMLLQLRLAHLRSSFERF